jgi:hypothetical protein
MIIPEYLFDRLHQVIEDNETDAVMAALDEVKEYFRMLWM